MVDHRCILSFWGLGIWLFRSWLLTWYTKTAWNKRQTLYVRLGYFGIAFVLRWGSPRRIGAWAYEIPTITEFNTIFSEIVLQDYALTLQKLVDNKMLRGLAMLEGVQ